MDNIYSYLYKRKDTQCIFHSLNMCSLRLDEIFGKQLDTHKSRLIANHRIVEQLQTYKSRPIAASPSLSSK